MDDFETMPVFGVDAILRDVHAQALGREEGEVADYIPELAKADPEPFGIAVATSRGRLHEIGDTRIPFTIQSVSKALTYCMALELVGRAEVLRRVGVEPSGDLQASRIWNDLLFGLVLTKSESVRPIMVALAGMQGVYGASDGPSVIAATLVGSAPTLILFLVLQRYFVRGLTLGMGER